MIHSIPHVAETDPSQALRALHRVLAQGRPRCIRTDFRVSLTGQIPHKLLRTFAGGSCRSSRFAPGSGTPSPPAQPGPLYYDPRSRRWWRNALSHLACVRSAPTRRLLEKSELECLFGNSRRAARILRRRERALPRVAAPFARYGLIRFLKTVPAGG